MVLQISTTTTSIRKTGNSYNEESIQVVKKGLEALEMPWACTSATPTTAPAFTTASQVDNAVDEALAGFCNRIDVAIHHDGDLSRTTAGASRWASTTENAPPPRLS